MRTDAKYTEPLDIITKNTKKELQKNKKITLENNAKQPATTSKELSIQIRVSRSLLRRQQQNP